MEIMQKHQRDQDLFRECVLEMRAFVNGGLYGMQLLNKVHGRILKHYHMETEDHDVFSASGVWMDYQNGNELKPYYL